MDHWYLTAPRTATRLDGAGARRPARARCWSGSRIRRSRRVRTCTSGVPGRTRGSPIGDARGAAVHGVGRRGGGRAGRVVRRGRRSGRAVHRAPGVHGRTGVGRPPACRRAVGLREAAISYLCSWSVSALHLGRYRAAETVVVVGQGLVGASAALVADAMGARVLAFDVDRGAGRVRPGAGIGRSRAARDSVARRSGSRRSCRRRVRSGPDLILETTGSWRGLRQAIQLARDFTRIAVMGIYRDPPPPDLGLELFGLLNAFPSKFHYRPAEHHRRRVGSGRRRARRRRTSRRAPRTGSGSCGRPRAAGCRWVD